MRRVLMMALAGAAFATATPALADTALHGYCNSATPCTDNGTNTPTNVNPPQFGFWTGAGGGTGDLLIDILVPDNRTVSGPLTFTGYQSGTATLFSSTAWTSGDLAGYLNLTAGSNTSSPNNPLSAFLPATQSYDSTANGFFVFQDNLGTVTIPNNPTDADLMQLDQGLPQGSYIVAFLGFNEQSCHRRICTDYVAYHATAPSGALLETAPPVPEPATWGMMLLGFVGIGLAVRRSPRETAVPQIA